MLSALGVRMNEHILQSMSGAPGLSRVSCVSSGKAPQAPLRMARAELTNHCPVSSLKGQNRYPISSHLVSSSSRICPLVLEVL